ncbi:hypothetical protein [Burkholderia cepacia]|uniref:hypothetical protein n=1 Tax=Burkholderia cepacia TaxID=292 RepID=UPI000F5DB0F1|nr:hypothetical protein [Burkholderia cepacia]MCA8029364.1 hypothetical protein [Burkholderia cepacia]
MNVYRVLPSHLNDTADTVCKYLSNHLGLAPGSIKIEGEVNPEIDFRPTLHAVTKEKQIVCVEIVEVLFPPEISNFVLSCRNHSIPAKLYCAIPAGTLQNYDAKSLAFANENGISILEVNATTKLCRILNQPPVSLSLGGLRKYKLSDYPSKYRASLDSAINTFRGGAPEKGCSVVYDELERLTRNIGKKCESIPGALKKAGVCDWDKAAWHSILEFLKTNIDLVHSKTPLLKGQLLSRLIGITELRNDTGHKPKSVQKMIERDIELKTRFESAMDELAKLIDAAKPLKV